MRGKLVVVWMILLGVVFTYGQDVKAAPSTPPSQKVVKRTVSRSLPTSRPIPTTAQKKCPFQSELIRYGVLDRVLGKMLTIRISRYLNIAAHSLIYDQGFRLSQSWKQAPLVCKAKHLCNQVEQLALLYCQHFQPKGSCSGYGVGVIKRGGESFYICRHPSTCTPETCLGVTTSPHPKCPSKAGPIRYKELDHALGRKLTMSLSHLINRAAGNLVYDKGLRLSQSWVQATVLCIEKHVCPRILALAQKHCQSPPSCPQYQAIGRKIQGRVIYSCVKVSLK